MHPYNYEHLARERRDSLVAAAETHRLVREARAQSSMAVPRVERRGRLARRLHSIAGRFQPGLAGGFRLLVEPAAAGPTVATSGMGGEVAPVNRD